MTFLYFIYLNYHIQIHPLIEDQDFFHHLFSDTKNLGTGVSLPYFFALSHDKNFTLTNKFFDKEHPLFLGEYNQALLNGSFLRILVLLKDIKGIAQVRLLKQIPFFY